MNGVITIRQEERDAVFNPPCDMPEYDLKKNVPVPCMVLGLFQGEEDAYFIAELQNGYVLNVDPWRIRLAPVTSRARFLGVPNA